MADFDLDLSSVTGELYDDIGDTIVRRFGLGVITRIIPRAPVDSGRYRGSWTVTFDTPSTSVPTGTDRGGSATLARGNAVLGGFNLRTNTAIYIQSNLPYSERLEAGSSTQAPAGVAGISLREETEAFERYGNT